MPQAAESPRSGAVSPWAHGAGQGPIGLDVFLLEFGLLFVPFLLAMPRSSFGMGNVYLVTVSHTHTHFLKNRVNQETTVSLRDFGHLNNARTTELSSSEVTLNTFCTMTLRCQRWNTIV